jgi:MFS family permease
MKRESDNFRSLLVMAAIGSYLLWSAGAAIPLLRFDLGISRTLAGTHNIAVGISATLGARLAVPLINRFGREWVMRTMLLLMFIGVISLVTAPTIFITVPAIGVAAFSQTIVNAISLAQISHDSAPSMRRMMIQTGIQAVVGATAILLISASLQADQGWRLPIIIGAIVLTPISLMNIWRVKFIAPEKARQEISDEGKNKDDTKILAFGIINCILEIGVGFWALDLLVSRDAPVALGALGSAILSYGIAIGRLSFAYFQPPNKLVIRFAVSAIITGAFIICIVTDPLLTMLGLTIAAFGISPLFALGAFRVSEGFDHADHRISRYMMGTSFSFGFAPFILAIVFDNFGYVVGYAALIPFAVACYVMWKINGPEKERSPIRD